MKIKKLVRKNIQNLKAYSSARAEFKGTAKVFLDANENPFNNGMNRYPDPLQWKLKEKLSEVKQIPKEQIFLGNGSDEAIDLLFRIFCEPRKDSVIILPPTFGMYRACAAIADVDLIKVPLDENFQPDVNTVLKVVEPNTKLLFICSPNNPTGNNIALEKIEKLIKSFSGIVVVDEAYIDFSKQTSTIELLSKYKNLVVLQTFSKAWAMASMRLGVAYASIEIINYFNKVKFPYNVNKLTQKAGLMVLERAAEVQANIELILEERKLLIQAFEKLDCIKKIYPTDANFILAKVSDANYIYNKLATKGIVVRNRSTVIGCEDCLRFTVGTPKENKRLLKVLRKY